MPKTEEILNGLQSIVNNYSTLAIIWHLFLYAMVIGLIARWMPSNKFMALLLCLPVVSVAVMAFVTGNPFNGVLFSLLAVLALIFGMKVSGHSPETSAIVFAVIGIMMIVFGLIYPHFVSEGSVLRYLYASPVGLIPCPTLSLIIGFLLLYNGFGSPSLTLTFVIFGLFYGIFGTLKLGVYVDAFLVFGTVSLFVKYLIAIRS